MKLVFGIKTGTLSFIPPLVSDADLKEEEEARLLV